MPSKSKLKSQISLDMQTEDSKRLLAFLKCPDCDDLADDAVETLCCHVLLCSACLQRRHNRCPHCQAACSYAPSHLARRLVGYQDWQCPSCGKETTRSERADHNMVCPQQERCCPAEGCAFRGLPDAFLLHLTDRHKQQLIDRAEHLFGPPTRERRPSRRRRFDSDSSLEESDSASDSSDRLEFMLRPSRSSFTGDASMTHVRITGKNYCRGPLNGPSCDCCDGRCGPRNGCNCVSCMRLDLSAFNVGTPRTLVNREGVIARMSIETGKFYCGRPVMSQDPHTDGFCGPNNGNNCHACARLDSQLRNRYADIAAEWDVSDAERYHDLRDMSSRSSRPAGSSRRALDTMDY